MATAAAALGLLALPGPSGALADVAGAHLVEPTTAQLAISALLAVLVVVAVWWRPLPQPSWAESWFGLERAAHAMMVHPTLLLARSAARVDDVLAATVDALADGARRVAGSVALADDRWVDAAVRAIAEGVRRAGDLARRPQTGLLQQYYVQGVVLVGVGLVLVVLVR